MGHTDTDWTFTAITYGRLKKDDAPMRETRSLNAGEKPLGNIRTGAWVRAWEKAGLPTEPGILKGVHNLRHTFGRRLRGAGVSLETRKALLGHAHGDITTHYSAAELQELLDAAEKIVDRGIAQTPTLTVLTGYKDESVGKRKRVTEGTL
ncbi:MAG TPA: hypothetical protein ENI80_08230 [Acidiferrobacteraceae bacterium]|nr:hypothetical protein [Acidiferrobacteraceae bacterium]